MRAGEIRLSEVARLPRNAKLHDVDDIADSFGEFGFVDRVIINEITGHLVSGHGRVDALERLRAKGEPPPEGVRVEGDDWYVPCDWIACEAEREDALALRLNVSQMKGGGYSIDEILRGFDRTVLDDLLTDASLAAAAGLEEAARKIAGAQRAQDAEPQIERAEELREQWGVESGQLWKLGEHWLICGDCADDDVLLTVMRDQKATLLMTDPPYGVSIGEKNRLLENFDKSGRCVDNIVADDLSPNELYDVLLPAFRAIKNHLSDDCSVFVFSPQGGELGMMMMMMMMDAGLPVRHVLNFVKSSPTFSMGRLDYDYQHEPIMFTWLRRHKRFKNGMWHSSVWFAEKTRQNHLHPTIKPVELYENAILNHTEPGDIVMDPFCGSGTALIACELHGRRCRAVEIEPKYVAVAIQRWVDATGKTPEVVHEPV